MTGAFFCSECGYENVVAGCGFCLQCGVEFNLEVHQAAVTGASVAEAEPAETAQVTQPQPETIPPQQEAVPSQQVVVQDPQMAEPAGVSVADAPSQVAQESPSQELPSQELIQLSAHPDAVPVSRGGTIDFQTAIATAEQCDFESGGGNWGDVDPYSVSGSVDVQPPSKDDFSDASVEVVPSEPSIAVDHAAAVPHIPVSQEPLPVDESVPQQPIHVAAPQADVQPVQVPGSGEHVLNGPEAAIPTAPTAEPPVPPESSASVVPLADVPLAAVALAPIPLAPIPEEQRNHVVPQPVADEFSQVLDDVSAPAVDHPIDTSEIKPVIAPAVAAGSQDEEAEGEEETFAERLEREMNSAIVSAAELVKMRVREDGDRLVAQLLIDGRPQLVFIERGLSSQQVPILSLYAVCGPASPENAMPLLEWNRALNMCGFAVREVSEKKMFVIQANVLAYSIGQSLLSKTLLEIAKRANQVNERLIG